MTISSESKICPNRAPSSARIVLPDRGPPQKIQACCPIKRPDACKEPSPFDSSPARTTGSMHESLKRKLLGGIDAYSMRLVGCPSVTAARQKHPLYHPTPRFSRPSDLSPPFPRLPSFQFTMMSGSS